MSDKRSVATDALETLGTIIDDKQKRDAIHLAVEPVVAGERGSHDRPPLHHHRPRPHRAFPDRLRRGPADRGAVVSGPSMATFWVRASYLDRMRWWFHGLRY